MRCGTCSRDNGVVKTRDVLKVEKYPKRENEAQGKRRGSGEKWGCLSGMSVWGQPLFWCCASLFNVLGEAARHLADARAGGGQKKGG
jgi:hypothetical protein